MTEEAGSVALATVPLSFGGGGKPLSPPKDHRVYKADKRVFFARRHLLCRVVSVHEWSGMRLSPALSSVKISVDTWTSFVSPTAVGRFAWRHDGCL